jgi:hypothetical protein
MADQDDGAAHFLLQTANGLHNLTLGDDIQGACRLVGNDDFW